MSAFFTSMHKVKTLSSRRTDRRELRLTPSYLSLDRTDSSPSWHSPLSPPCSAPPNQESQLSNRPDFGQTTHHRRLGILLLSLLLHLLPILFLLLFLSLVINLGELGIPFLSTRAISLGDTEVTEVGRFAKSEQ